MTPNPPTTAKGGDCKRERALLDAIERCLSSDFLADLEFKRHIKKKKFTEDEADSMHDILEKLFRVVHAARAECCKSNASWQAELNKFITTYEND